MTNSSTDGGGSHQDGSQNANVSENVRANLSKVLSAASDDERAALEEVWHAAESGMSQQALDPNREAAVWEHLAAVALASGRESSSADAQPDAPPNVHALDQAGQRRGGRGITRISRRIAALAATVVVLVVAIYLSGLFAQRAPVTFATNAGETQRVSLPDGSVVEMNAGTFIEYEELLAARIVRLEGEAFFDVTTVADPSGKPFRVETFNATVAVLGTRFNVRARANDVEPSTAVALEEGVVSLRAADTNTQPAQSQDTIAESVVTMYPGETRAVTSSGAISDAGPVDGAMAWRTGGVFYRDVNLTSVLADLERRFAIEIDLTATDAANRRVNLALRSPSNAEEVIETLCAGYGLAYRQTANGFLITTFEP